MTGSGGGGAPNALRRSETRLAWALILPAVAVIALVALFPLLWAGWESLHVHDLRMPWRGYPFVGFQNYLEAFRTPRFRESLAHTAGFAVVSVGLEMGLGLFLALALNRAYRGRGLVRMAVLVPWAIPTVVSALLWRFLFESRAGVVNAILGDLHLVHGSFVWFSHPWAAWVPVVLADAWKMTPFVTLLLLAGLQNIDETLYEAARVDGAGAWTLLVRITLPLLKPAILVALVFRTLDAFRVFDLVYVLTGGGPGTATEPVALYTFDSLLQNLRFGYGSALAVIVFLVTFALALAYVRVLGAGLTGEPER